jgi:Polycystin cation channel
LLPSHPWFVILADVIAIALFFIIIKFIKYLRVIPHWGPMLLAVVDTMRDSAVLLYLLVLLALQLACAFAFHIAFGGENNHFSTMSRSFISMFRMVGSCVSIGASVFPF